MNDPNVQAKLRAGKNELRARRKNLSLPEKVAQVVQLQSVVLPLVRRRRELKPWEKVWNLRARLQR
jgi:hypothetical protein